MSKSLIIAVDFDGTIVEHKFPDIGEPVPFAFDWMKKWIEAGAKLLLWTMRSDGQQSGNVLSEAVEFCKANGVVFEGINVNPAQRSWTDSPKAYAHVYVDDAAFGCPLCESKEMGARPMVDWEQVGPSVLSMIQADA